MQQKRSIGKCGQQHSIALHAACAALLLLTWVKGISGTLTNTRCCSIRIQSMSCTDAFVLLCYFFVFLLLVYFFSPIRRACHVHLALYCVSLPRCILNLCTRHPRIESEQRWLVCASECHLICIVRMSFATRSRV